MAHKIHDADNIVTARKGALHEKLTEFFKNLQMEITSGGLTAERLAELDASFLAANLLTAICRSGDGRISDQSLTR
jgi:hypothetical protein